MDTAQKMKFSITNFFSKCDQIRRKLRTWSHLLKKSVMENFIFFTVGAGGEHRPSLMTNCTCGAIQNEILSATGQKHTWRIYTIENLEDNLISNIASAKRLNIRQ